MSHILRACPFFMAGKVLIPSAERWARVCGQERDCLQPPAVLGSSGPAGWPCSDMFILQARCWPRHLAGPSGGLLLMGTGWRLGAGGCLCLCCLLSHSLLFYIQEARCGTEGQGPPCPPQGRCPHHSTFRSFTLAPCLDSQGRPCPELYWEAHGGPLCLPSRPASVTESLSRTPGLD